MQKEKEIGEIHRSRDELAELSTSFQIQLQAQTADSKSFFALMNQTARLKSYKNKKIRGDVTLMGMGWSYEFRYVTCRTFFRPDPQVWVVWR